MPGNLDRAVGAGAGGAAAVSGGGSVARSLHNVGIRSTICWSRGECRSVSPDQSVWVNGRLTNEGSTTSSLHVGGNSALAEGGEIGLGDIVHLLNARSTKVDAAEGAILAGGNLGNDLDELADG